MISPKGILVALLLMVAAASRAGAASLDYSDILGTWCGSQDNPNWTNYEISRSALTVIHLPGRTRTVLQIDHFEFTDTSVVIFYLSAGHGRDAGTPGNTISRVELKDFGTDTMVQAESDVSGQYHFRRCRG